MVVNRGELLNKNFMQLIHADDHVIVHRNIVKEYAPPYAIRMAKKNGQHLFVEIESRNLKKQDEVLRVSAVRDITDRMQAENEKNKLQEQLLQSQKMESIGRLAGGVAHDFNNMLGVILGYSEMAVEQVAEGHPILATLHEIQQAAQRSADLTKQLLAFARKQTAVPKVLDLNRTVETMLAMLRRLIGENIDLSWLPGKGLGLIKIDPSQVDQILANLCVNSRDSIIGNTGKITIETANFDADETFCAEHTDIGPGKYIQLTFSDNGSGMEPEILSHLFEPFFTTKNLGEGTGLGLAMIYGIVKQNHGAISVNSKPGQGTTFRIYLPLYKAKAGSVQIDSNITKKAGCETILLVEDEPMILEMTTLMLKGLGYNILSAATPIEAIRLAEEHSGEIQMLMTDIIMPEMNGRDLAQKLSSLHPEIKRLFMSGYTADIIAQHGVLEEEMNFLQKPFSRKELSTKVREVLALVKE
jgi:signal transduction histidine kinase